MLNYIKTLGLKPLRDLPPRELANECVKLSKRGEAYAAEPGNHPGTYAVGRGSHSDLKPYIGRILAKDDKPVFVLVGKGICFDTGGYSIKPSNQMHEMKFDMLGAATVLSVYKHLPRKIRDVTEVIVPCAANLVSSTAQVPGDIIRYPNGMRVEVTNTDAEGRLVLADGMNMVRDKKSVEYMFTVATLTGAVTIALGDKRSGVMSNDDALGREIQDLGDKIKDPCWHLPIDKEHRDNMRHTVKKIADLRNISKGSRAGASNAAAFLEFFVPKKVTWAHFDIAGSAYAKEIPTGASAKLIKRILETR